MYDYDIVQKSGSWFAYGDERLGQGRENAKQFLKDNPEIREEIAQKIRVAAGIVAGEAEATEEEEEVMDAELLAELGLEENKK